MKKYLYFIVSCIIMSYSCKKDNDNTSTSGTSVLHLEDKQEIAAEIFSASLTFGMGEYSNLKSTESTTLDINFTSTNPKGGNVEVSGSVTTSITFNDQTQEITSTMINMNLYENFNDYVVYTSNGNKYYLSTLSNPINIKADIITIGFQNFESSSKMTVKGTINAKAGAISENIMYDLTININTTGTGGTMTGTINGVEVNATFTE